MYTTMSSKDSSTQTWLDESNSTDGQTIITTSSKVDISPTLHIVLPICGLIFFILLLIILYRVKAMRRMNSLRNRLVSLRRYDPALRGSKAEQVKVQTPEINHDPLLLFSFQDVTQKPQTSST